MSQQFQVWNALAWLTCFIASSMLFETSSASDYVIEALVIVDNAGLNKWENITAKQYGDFTKEMRSTFFEVSELLKTMEVYDLSVSIQIQEIVVLNNNILKTDSKGRTQTSQSAVEFRQWMRDSSYKDTYDLAVLMTGVDLYQFDRDNDTAYGYAWLDKVCDNGGVGVIEITATYEDALRLAHEIGHILGADHDGTKGGKNCASKNGKILNPVSKQSSRNKFFFSSCSAAQIKQTFQSLPRNCLTQDNPAGVLTGPRYGTLMTPDQVCQRQIGPHSYVARNAYASYGNNVCIQLACMTETVGTYFHWRFVNSPPGLACGANKQCVQGECVETNGSCSTTSDSCPFGDQPKIEGNYGFICAQLKPEKCQYWTASCCETCNAGGPGWTKTADEVCKELAGNTSSMARRAYAVYGDDFCSKLACLTKVEKNWFWWNTYTAPDGMACGKNKRCKSGKCIPSNHGNTVVVSDVCPWGDQTWLAGTYQTTCPDFISKNGCQGMKEVCCKSCM